MQNWKCQNPSCGHYNPMSAEECRTCGQRLDRREPITVKIREPEQEDSGAGELLGDGAGALIDAAIDSGSSGGGDSTWGGGGGDFSGGRSSGDF